MISPIQKIEDGKNGYFIDLGFIRMIYDSLDLGNKSITMDMFLKTIIKSLSQYDEKQAGE